MGLVPLLRELRLLRNYNAMIFEQPPAADERHAVDSFGTNAASRERLARIVRRQLERARFRFRQNRERHRMLRMHLGARCDGEQSLIGVFVIERHDALH